MSKFAKWGDRDRKVQTYDRKNITITKAGKTYNVYDATQAANVDTNIYDVMKKYHCKEDEAVRLMEERGGEQGIYADIVELQKKIQDIGDVQQVAQKAQEMFEQLPVEVKQKYGNNLEAFFKENQKKAEQNKAELTKDENNNKEEVTNETK